MQIGHLDFHKGDLVIATLFVGAMSAKKVEEYITKSKETFEEFFGKDNVLVIPTTDDRGDRLSLVVVHRHK